LSSPFELELKRCHTPLHRNGGPRLTG
jgi:hypothetical protein